MEITIFKRRLEELLKSSNLSKERGNNIDLKEVFNFVYQNRQAVTDINTLLTCCKCLLSALIEFECSDRNVIARILDMCWRASAFNLTAIQDDTKVLTASISFILSPLNLSDQKKYPLAIWSWWKAIFSAECIDVTIVRVLIKYGLYYVPPDAAYYDVFKAEDFLVNFFIDAEQYGFGSMEDFIRAQSQYVRILVKELLHDLRSTHGHLGSVSKESPESKRGFMRILLIICTLRAISFKWNDHSFLNGYVTCIGLHFRTDSEPFLTKGDIQDFLRYLFIHENCEEGIERVVKTYEILFSDENSVQYCPRSLKHLCRCFLRKTLIRKPELLPDTVSVLEIPDSLKNFLLGDPKLDSSV